MFRDDLLTFIHEPAMVKLFRELADGTRVRIDATAAEFIDFDIKEKVADFVESAPARNITVALEGIELPSDVVRSIRPRRVEPVVVHRPEPAPSRA